MNAALLWKEWREQRWRCVLGTLVLTAISASLVRAQIVTLPEALVLVFGPLGLMLAVFMAMGSVATERADETWDFLRAQPIGPARILRLKWLVGAAYLVVAFLVAGGAAHLAAWSRGLFDLAPPPEWVWPYTSSPLVLLGTSAGSLWMLVLSSMTAMLALYTVLFFVLTRARDELHAGLGGVLLTIACLAWILQYRYSISADGVVAGIPLKNILWTSSLLNPLSPLVFSGEPALPRCLAFASALVLWVAGPLLVVGWLERRGRLT